MTDSQICDRQGCLEQETEMRTLPDGCLVNVCERHMLFFAQDAKHDGVYFHQHYLADREEYDANLPPITPGYVALDFEVIG